MFRIQSFYFFPNSKFPDTAQNEKIGYRIPHCACKRWNESGTKTSHFHDEFRNFRSTVNEVLLYFVARYFRCHQPIRRHRLGSRFLYLLLGNHQLFRKLVKMQRGRTHLHKCSGMPCWGKVGSGRRTSCELRTWSISFVSITWTTKELGTKSWSGNRFILSKLVT